MLHQALGRDLRHQRVRGARSVAPVEPECERKGVPDIIGRRGAEGFGFIDHGRRLVGEHAANKLPCCAAARPQRSRPGPKQNSRYLSGPAFSAQLVVMTKTLPEFRRIVARKETIACSLPLELVVPGQGAKLWRSAIEFHRNTVTPS
jgi:hypothetical protein